IRLKKITYVAVLLAIGLLLSACGDSPAEKIHKNLEESVDKEETAQNSQKEIAKLEEKENEIFDQVVDLSLDDFDKIKKHSNNALENIEKRTDKLKQEKEKTTNAKIEKSNDKIENEKTKKKAQEMKKQMDKRYKTYEDFNKIYADTLKDEKTLYTLLKKKDVEQKEVDKTLEKLNETYEKLISKNESFNSETEKYNQLKKEFYEGTDLKIKYKD